MAAKSSMIIPVLNASGTVTILRKPGFALWNMPELFELHSAGLPIRIKDGNERVLFDGEILPEHQALVSDLVGLEVSFSAFVPDAVSRRIYEAEFHFFVPAP